MQSHLVAQEYMNKYGEEYLDELLEKVEEDLVEAELVEDEEAPGRTGEEPGVDAQETTQES